ncbi:MAG: ABC transporter ATP-binding protein [Pseudomonadota bacterium]
MPDKAIEVIDLVKEYPAQRSLVDVLRGRGSRGTAMRALDHVSFDVGQGEVLGLLGANGAGKTTLINILCTLLTPTSGSARIGGHDVEREPKQARRLVGLVTSNERSFYWRLTGRQNLRFFADLYHVPAGDVDNRIVEFLEALDLTRFADRRFDSYSTGIRQRFAFARAMLHRPRILFMDEPTKGLDPNASASMLQVIKERILPAWQPTILVTSHNLTEIEKLCDRVAIVDRGRLLRLGTLGELARSIRSQEAYSVQVAALQPRMLDKLRALLGDERVRVRNQEQGLLELGFEDGEHGLTRALSVLIESGATIRRCEPIEVSLEDVFRQTVAQPQAVAA